MLYLFSGEDFQNKLKAYENLLKQLEKKSEVIDIGRNDFNRTQVESLYSGSNLFGDKTTTVFRDVLENADIREFVLERLTPMGESENSFIFVEGKLNKPIIDLFKKARAEINVFEAPKERTQKFNTFLLANAFGDKDKRNLWIYFRQAVESGASLEEIVGIIFWKIKDMMLKKNFSKFREEELQDSLTRLSAILPRSRREGKDSEAMLEQFLLQAF